MVDFAQARRTMVDSQLRTFDVNDIPLLDAMDEVPRERFVLPGRERPGLHRPGPAGQRRAERPIHALADGPGPPDPGPGDRARDEGSRCGLRSRLFVGGARRTRGRGHGAGVGRDPRRPPPGAPCLVGADGVTVVVGSSPGGARGIRSLRRDPDQRRRRDAAGSAAATATSVGAAWSASTAAAAPPRRRSMSASGEPRVAQPLRCRRARAAPFRAEGRLRFLT